MTKCVVFDSVYEAKEWNCQISNERFGFDGHKTMCKFSMRPLDTTATITKAEYAAGENIPMTIETEEDGHITNPEYTALDAEYTVNQWAVIVDDALIECIYNEETGELISEDEPDYVVDIVIPVPVGE